MKITIQYNDTQPIYSIMEAMVSQVTASAFLQNDKIPDEVLNGIKEIVIDSMKTTLNIIFNKSNGPITLEYNLEAGVASTFETTCKIVKYMEHKNGQEER